jgi:acyl-coenzyme A thioesterase PaaI-like protein
MFEKSPEAPSFYRSQGPSADGREGFESLPTTASPWGADSQHGGPPAGLLVRAIEGLSDAVVGRFTMELLGPVPVGEVAVSGSILRPGRTVQLAAAEMYDVARGRPVATARAWLFPATASGPEQEPSTPTHGPEDGVHRERPTGWGGGYVDAVDWRWIAGDLAAPGPGVVWMRPPDLVEGERASPVQRLMTCADSASGVSAVFDPQEWGFLNTELTVHVLRPPEGDWLCLDAETHLSGGSVGMAVSEAHDRRGLVARSTQALLVQPRTPR